MKEELTTKMHSEFDISENNERKLTAWTVLDLVGGDINDEKVDYYCNLYGVTKIELYRHKKSWILGNL